MYSLRGKKSDNEQLLKAPGMGKTEGQTGPHLVEVMILVWFQQVEGFSLLITCSRQKVIKHMVVPVDGEKSLVMCLIKTEKKIAR